MKDDEPCKHMPSLAPSHPPSRSEEIDNQFWRLTDKLNQLIGRDEGVSKLDELDTKLTYKLEDLDSKLDDLDSKLDELDTKLTDKLEDLGTKRIAMFKLCAVVAAFIALIWGAENDPWWYSAFKGGAYLWFLNWIRKQ